MRGAPDKPHAASVPKWKTPQRAGRTASAVHHKTHKLWRFLTNRHTRLGDRILTNTQNAIYTTKATGWPAAEDIGYRYPGSGPKATHNNQGDKLRGYSNMAGQKQRSHGSDSVLIGATQGQAPPTCIGYNEGGPCLGAGPDSNSLKQCANSGQFVDTETRTILSICRQHSHSVFPFTLSPTNSTFPPRSASKSARPESDTRRRTPS